MKPVDLCNVISIPISTLCFHKAKVKLQLPEVFGQLCCPGYIDDMKLYIFGNFHSCLEFLEEEVFTQIGCRSVEE